MSHDTRLRQLERNYDLLRAELAQVKKLGQDYKLASDHLEALRSTELRTLQSEVEHLRIENQRLRDQLDRYTSKPTPREGVEVVEFPVMNADLFPGVGFDPDSATDERYTPTRYFKPWDDEFHFTLDACATSESTKCIRFFSAPGGDPRYDGEAGRDGLAQSWRGERVWCNPPYSDIASWVEKAWRAFAELVVMLVPAWTDRKWWAENVEPYRDHGNSIRLAGRERTRSTLRLTTRFLPGRISFGMPGNPEGLGVGSPRFTGYVLLIWRDTA